jgi:hypothetical protein
VCGVSGVCDVGGVRDMVCGHGVCGVCGMRSVGGVAWVVWVVYWRGIGGVRGVGGVVWVCGWWFVVGVESTLWGPCCSHVAITPWEWIVMRVGVSEARLRGTYCSC